MQTGQTDSAQNWAETPVLFLIFNRPQTTAQVFQAIRNAKPRRLYVAADGPRTGEPADKESCQRAREIATAIDWECRLFTKFHQSNHGCKKAVSSGIDWFFQNEAKGIVLEDDCLPSLSFFKFCHEMLNRFEDDNRIMHINGSNFFWNRISTDYSYLVSKYGNIWGWATWRRAWERYDVDINDWPLVRRHLNRNGFYDRREISLRKWQIETIKSGQLDTWDYQWILTKMLQTGFSIVPKVNLVKNIGFIEDSTHTKPGRDLRSKLLNQELVFPLTHMDYIYVDRQYDRMMQKRILRRYYQTRINAIKRRILG